MKRNIILTIVLLFSSIQAWSIDTEIRILSVYTSGSSGDVAKMNDALDYFEGVFLNSSISVSPNVASPVALNMNYSGNVVTQYQQAAASQALIDLRNNHGADVVVVFTSNVIGYRSYRILD